MTSRIVGVLLLSAAAVSAQTPPVAEVTVLKAARLFDGKGDTAVRDGVVIVEGDRIKAVGSGPARRPPAPRVIDLGDATLLPGFIDAHVHLTGESSRQLVPGHGRRPAADACAETGDPRHRVRAPDADGRLHHRAQRRRRATTSTSACATPSTPASCPARACWSPATPSARAAATATTPASPTSSSASETGIAEGIASGADAASATPCASRSSTAPT